MHSEIRWATALGLVHDGAVGHVDAGGGQVCGDLVAGARRDLVDYRPGEGDRAFSLPARPQAALR